MYAGLKAFQAYGVMLFVDAPDIIDQRHCAASRAGYAGWHKEAHTLTLITLIKSRTVNIQIDRKPGLILCYFGHLNHSNVCRGTL